MATVKSTRSPDTKMSTKKHRVSKHGISLERILRMRGAYQIHPNVARGPVQK